MKIKILNHNEIAAGVKEVNGVDIFNNKKVQLTLTGESYDNFIKYIMYLWSGDLRSVDIVTKVVNNGNRYCFYKG